AARPAGAETAPTGADAAAPAPGPALAQAAPALEALIDEFTAELTAAGAVWGGAGSDAHLAALQRWRVASGDAVEARRALVEAAERAGGGPGLGGGGLAPAPLSTTATAGSRLPELGRQIDTHLDAVSATGATLSAGWTGPDGVAAMQALARWNEAAMTVKAETSRTALAVEAFAGRAA
ncbi:MAG: hypothetical protein KDB10_23495, partial [Acidimicrobiales bacterium]|nr:hypothetical protein [Acidimicrobiales bacterium]